MQEVTFDLQTITPLFVAGADQTRAEIRAPTFRGLMRYWQRALVGGLVGTGQDGLKRVMQAETEVFGATNSGSAVAIKVSGVSGEPREFTEPISTRVGGRWQATGKGYLLWSMAKSGKEERGNLKPARWYFPPGTHFKASLSSRSRDDSEELEKAVAAFWLLTQLGGIGSRSRRCAGSLAAQLVEKSTTNFPFTAPPDVLVLKQQIEQGLRTARSLYSFERRIPREAHFDVLAPQTCRIWILQDEQPWRSYETAMQKLGERLQEYRSHISIGPRKIFGLPLPPIIFNKRRASPLLLRVTKLQGEQYVGVAVLFKTALGDVNIGDYRLIEEWANEFRGKQEVRL